MQRRSSHDEGKGKTFPSFSHGGLPWIPLPGGFTELPRRERNQQVTTDHNQTHKEVTSNSYEHWLTVSHNRSNKNVQNSKPLRNGRQKGQPGRIGAENHYNKGGKGVTSELGSNLGNLSKGDNGSRKDNDGFRYNIQSNGANSKVGGSRFDVLGEVEDDITKGSHGHSKLQTNDVLTYISNVKATGKVGINYKKKVKAA
ncbi:hypothetical protein ACOSQ2_023279 [Xanthoceras sorbifolium]